MASNIELGERVFFNFNCVVLDVCPVRIGAFSLFGPAVQIYTPMHPMSAELRRQQEYGKPVEIGSDVWVGGGAVILPGVTHRIAGGDRRGKRGHARRTGGSVRRGKPLPGDSRYRRLEFGREGEVRRVGLEPTTYGLKARCSTS